MDVTANTRSHFRRRNDRSSCRRVVYHPGESGVRPIVSGGVHADQARSGRGTSRIRTSRRSRRTTRDASSSKSPRLGAIGAVATSMRGRRPGRQAPQGLADLPNVKKSSYVTDAKLDPVNCFAADHQLQQLLRVRHEQDRPGAERRPAQDAALDREDRRHGRQARRLRDRRPHQDATSSRSAIYRHRCVEALVVRDSLGRHSRSKTLIDKVQPTSQAKYVEFTTLMRAERDARPADCRHPVPVHRRPAHGRGACIRSRSWSSASTARCCRTRTARRSAFTFPGSTASRAASRSSASGSPTSSRRTRGRCRRRTNTASTPT